MTLLNEFGERCVIRADDDEIIFPGYGEYLLHRNVFQKENLPLLEIANPTVAVVEHVDAPIKSDTLENPTRRRFVNSHRVAGQREIGNRAREFSQIMEAMSGRYSGSRRGRAVFRATGQQRGDKEAWEKTLFHSWVAPQKGAGSLRVFGDLERPDGIEHQAVALRASHVAAG